MGTVSISNLSTNLVCNVHGPIRKKEPARTVRILPYGLDKELSKNRQPYCGGYPLVAVITYHPTSERLSYSKKDYQFEQNT